MRADHQRLEMHGFHEWIGTGTVVVFLGLMLPVL